MNPSISNYITPNNIVDSMCFSYSSFPRINQQVDGQVAPNSKTALVPGVGAVDVSAGAASSGVSSISVAWKIGLRFRV